MCFNVFSFVRRVELCSYIFVFFFTFLLNCDTDIINFANILLNDFVDFVPPKNYYFFIGKVYSVDNYEMANILTWLATY